MQQLPNLPNRLTADEIVSRAAKLEGGRMKALILAVHRAVTEHYDCTKPWDVDFVKFTIHFDGRGRVIEISYTPIPEEYEADLVERVRRVSEPYGNQFRGTLAHVVVGFKNPSRN